MTGEEEFQAWQDWRSTCALARLSEAQRAHLTEGIAQRFRSRIRKLAGAGVWGGKLPSSPPDPECAHLFESHLALHHRRDGKSYKNWLLTRGQRDLNTVQSGVMLLIRNVVKDWLRDAHPRTAPLSLQATFGNGARLEECLPSPGGEDLQELTNWIHRHVDLWRGELTPVEQMMLAIRARGWIFSSPQAEAAAGVKKSTLHKTHRGLLMRWGEAFRDAHPGVRPDQAASVLLEAMDRMGEEFIHLLAEKPESAAFGEAKETYED